MYNLGAVGFGHWFNRLYAGLRDSGEVKVAKIAGVSSIDGKLKKMREMGIGEDAYYQIGMDGPIPDRFYDGLDIVHISDPNEYHAEQTMDSLRHGKITITEKTWGINKKEFDDVARFVEDNDLGNKAYLHLHYLQKQLTKGLDASKGLGLSMLFKHIIHCFAKTTTNNPNNCCHSILSTSSGRYA